MFIYLNKGEKDQWLPQLFDLLYENMQTIAPSGLSYEAEKAQWLKEVSPALEKEPRKILLCFVGEELAGYLQYYIRDGLLMVEELQLKKKYQRSLLFYSLCKYLRKVLPQDLKTVEAYADKRNAASIRLMERLGMKVCEDETPAPFVHLRAPAESIYRFFMGNTQPFSRV
ncbi:MAG: GNAT family N-acetyltransferase [Ruminococcaceae bacterium]|nr:GNAT family N-acetyltransferase [Oscillospiraceae bacterium]